MYTQSPSKSQKLRHTPIAVSAQGTPNHVSSGESQENRSQTSAVEQRQSDAANFRQLQSDFFNRRKLEPPFANRLHLLGITTGVGISGGFYLWSFGLQDGFGTFVISTILATILYWVSALCIAELSSAFPFSGGPTVHSSSAFGPFVGALTGYVYAITFISVSAVNFVALGDYTAALFQTTSSAAQPLYWLVFCVYVYFVTRKTHILFKTTTFLCCTAVFMILIYTTIAFVYVGESNVSENYDILDGFGETVSLSGVARTIPYAMWWYLGLEALPVASEHANSFISDAPQSIIGSVGILNICAFVLLFLCPAISPGVIGLMSSDHPIVISLGTVFEIDKTQEKLSLTNSNGSPSRAIGLTGVLAYGLALCVHAYNSERTGVSIKAGDILLRIACFFPAITYLLEFCAYIKIKISLPTLPRPFKSPIGIFGAILGIAVVLVEIIGGLATDTWLHVGLWGCSIAFVLIFRIYFKRVSVNAAENSAEKMFIKQRLADMYIDKVTSNAQTSGAVKSTRKSSITYKKTILALTGTRPKPSSASASEKPNDAFENKV
ncbi:hypothetical protein BKA69DRAFT_1079918 [Paraphysoderma sedebokerense]|nr:hypothetical protein BKA69DRAFT_1079918 [Paraphysoderma sedebokerense]